MSSESASPILEGHERKPKGGKSKEKGSGAGRKRNREIRGSTKKEKEKGSRNKGSSAESSSSGEKRNYSSEKRNSCGKRSFGSSEVVHEKSFGKKEEKEEKEEKDEKEEKEEKEEKAEKEEREGKEEKEEDCRLPLIRDKGEEEEDRDKGKERDSGGGCEIRVTQAVRGRSNSDLTPEEYATWDRKDSHNLFGKIGGIFKRNQSLEAKMKKEEIEYTKEMKKRTRYQQMNEKKESMLRPIHDSETFSDKFVTTSNEEARINKNYAFYVECLDDLPPDIHDSLERMRIPANVLEAHFELLLNILSFADKHIPRRRFVTHAQLEKIRKQRQTVLPNLTDRVLLHPRDAYETVSFIEARQMYKWDVYLGHGGFGQVVEAKCKIKKDPRYGSKFALKFQKNENERAKRMNIEEVSLLKFCDHPNIVKMFRSLEVRSEVWMVMELLRGGNLKQASTNKVVPFSESEIAYVAAETLKGIDYLHKRQIAHRDLKNLNIMLSVKGEVKIIDFGLAVDMSTGSRVQMVGSPLWMAPEMIRGEPHSYGVDVWSFIVCMLELANQKPPNVSNIKRAMFLSATIGMAEDKFVDPVRWSKDFSDFISWGGTMMQEERPTAENLLNHKFTAGACNVKMIRKKLEGVFLVDALSERALVG